MLTGVVLCKNERKNLPRCLSSLKFCDQILVIDDESTDDSREIAASYGAKVITHSLNSDFSSQRNFALTKVSPGWVLFVDADEQVSPKLASQIIAAMGIKGPNAYFIKRTDILWDHSFTFGDLKDFSILRLAKSDAGKWFGKVHETWKVDGQTGILSGPLYHYPHPSLYEFIHSLNEYSSIRSGELYSQSVSSNIVQVILLPLAKFIHLYILKLGFLDGFHGLIHSMCMSFYTFLVRGKLYLLSKGIGEYD